MDCPIHTKFKKVNIVYWYEFGRGVCRGPHVKDVKTNSRVLFMFRRGDFLEVFLPWRAEDERRRGGKCARVHRHMLGHVSLHPSCLVAALGAPLHLGCAIARKGAWVHQGRCAEVCLVRRIRFVSIKKLFHIFFNSRSIFQMVLRVFGMEKRNKHFVVRRRLLFVDLDRLGS